MAVRGGQSEIEPSQEPKLWILTLVSLTNGVDWCASLGLSFLISKRGEWDQVVFKVPSGGFCVQGFKAKATAERGDLLTITNSLGKIHSGMSVPLSARYPLSLPSFRIYA